jgi:hypothetical protein
MYNCCNMYNYCNMCNISICFYNIRMKQLQHTYETSETFEMYTCNMSFQCNISLLSGRNGGSSTFEVYQCRARQWRRATSQGDAMPLSASQSRSTPCHRPLEAPWELDLDLDPRGRRVPAAATIVGRGEAACCHCHHWGGREEIATESIGEEEAPSERKERGRRGSAAVGRGMATTAAVGIGWYTDTAAGCGPMASVACGEENLILPFG